MKKTPKPHPLDNKLQEILDEVEYEADEAARAAKNLQRIADRLRAIVEGR